MINGFEEKCCVPSFGSESLLGTLIETFLFSNDTKIEDTKRTKINYLDSSLTKLSSSLIYKEQISWTKSTQPTVRKKNEETFEVICNDVDNDTNIMRSALYDSDNDDDDEDRVFCFKDDVNGSMYWIDVFKKLLDMDLLSSNEIIRNSIELTDKDIDDTIPRTSSDDSTISVMSSIIHFDSVAVDNLLNSGIKLNENGNTIIAIESGDDVSHDKDFIFKEDNMYGDTNDIEISSSSDITNDNRIDFPNTPTKENLLHINIETSSPVKEGRGYLEAIHPYSPTSSSFSSESCSYSRPYYGTQWNGNDNDYGNNYDNDGNSSDNYDNSDNDIDDEDKKEGYKSDWTAETAMMLNRRSRFLEVSICIHTNLRIYRFIHLYAYHIFIDSFIYMHI